MQPPLEPNGLLVDVLGVQEKNGKQEAETKT